MAGETLEPTRTQETTIPWHRLPVDKEAVVGYGTVLPVLFLYFMIALAPALYAINASFYSILPLNPVWEFVGIDNYVKVLTGEFTATEFWGSLWRGLIYMLGSTLLQLAVGLWLALVLNKLAVGQKALTAVVFTAYLIPTVIVALTFQYMLDPELSVGVLQMIGGDVLGLWGTGANPLGTRSWAMPLLVLIGTWKFAVFITIFALAQLRSIPDRFYEAAKVCGANRLQMFRDITLPRIQGVILVAVLLRSIFMFNKFDIIWILTEGGPGAATQTLPVFAYETAFGSGPGNLGLANAIAVIMFLFLLLAAVLYFLAFNPSEEVETSA